MFYRAQVNFTNIAVSVVNLGLFVELEQQLFFWQHPPQDEAFYAETVGCFKSRECVCLCGSKRGISGMNIISGIVGTAVPP